MPEDAQHGVEGNQDHKEEFRLHPETLIEAAESLIDTDDNDDTYLASELKAAFEEGDIDHSMYRDIETRASPQEGTVRCHYCGEVYPSGEDHTCVHQPMKDFGEGDDGE